MKKIVSVLFLFIFLTGFSVFAQETFTLTTYYPAPFGIYQRLVTNTLGVGDNDGSGSIDAGDAPDPTNPNQQGEVWIAEKLGIGTAFPFQELHIRSTDNLAGYATILLEGVNPASGKSTGNWMIMAPGTGAPPYGIMPGDFRISYCTDDGCTPPARRNIFTIRNSAPSDSLFVSSTGSIGLGTRAPSSGQQTLKLDVEGAVGATHYCDEDGNNCMQPPLSGADLYTWNGQRRLLTRQGKLKVLTGKFYCDDAFDPLFVRWRNSPFQKIYGVYATGEEADKDFFIKKNGASINSVIIECDSKGWGHFLVVGD